MNYKAFPFYQRTDLETIFNDTYEIYRRHFGWLFFFSFLFLLIMQPVTGYFLADKMSDINQFMEDTEALLSFYKSLWLFAVIFLVAYTFLYLFLYHFIVARYLAPGMSVWAILGKTLSKYYLRALFVALFSYLIIVFGTVLGLLALIIGAFVAAIYLSVSLSPVFPILLMEERGIFSTIGRSFRLVLNDFWHVLGYLMIFGMVYTLVNLIFSAISMAPYASSFLHHLFSTQSPDMQGTFGTFSLMTQPLYVIISSLFSALLLPLIPIFSTLIYFHLRYVEDEKQAPVPEETSL